MLAIAFAILLVTFIGCFAGGLFINKELLIGCLPTALMAAVTIAAMCSIEEQ
jgi:uncharacterized membrane protein